MTARELALPVLDHLDLPTPVHVEAAAAAGFDAVTLRVAGTAGDVPADLNDRRRVAQARAALDATGLGVLDVEVLRLGPHLPPDEAARAVDLAAELGARHLLCVDSGWGETTSLAGHLALVRELAEPAGVGVVLEFMAFSACGDLSAAVAAADLAGVGVLVDLLHLHRSGGGPDELAAAVAELGPERFPYAQLCDAPAVAPPCDGLREEAVRSRRLPGEGELPLHADLAALPAEIPLSVEAPSPSNRVGTPTQRAAATMNAVRALLTVDPV